MRGRSYLSNPRNHIRTPGLLHGQFLRRPRIGGEKALEDYRILEWKQVHDGKNIHCGRLDRRSHNRIRKVRTLRVRDLILFEASCHGFCAAGVDVGVVERFHGADY